MFALVISILALGFLHNVEPKTACLPQKIQMKALALDDFKYITYDGNEFSPTIYLVAIDYSRRLYAVADGAGNDFVINLGNSRSFDTDVNGVCYSYDVTNELVIPRNHCLPASAHFVRTVRVGLGSDPLAIQIWEYYIEAYNSRQRVRLLLSANPGDFQYPLLFTVNGSSPSHPLGSTALFLDASTTVAHPEILDVTDPCPEMPFRT